MNETLTSLNAISPIDGRYAAKTSRLRTYTSEYALIYYRVLVEVSWFKQLASMEDIAELPSLTKASAAVLDRIIEDFDENDAQQVKDFEATTNHDVKAVEYFLKEKIKASKDTALLKSLEFIHFACTSEDINNISHALMLCHARDKVVLPEIISLRDAIGQLARKYANVPMLSRTHGQVASPTTMGKEMANVMARMQRQLEIVRNVSILGKVNGAVGNFNAHLSAYPDIDWLKQSQDFVESLGLEWNPYTTQIEPHDYIAELFDAICRVNTILLDFNRDIWSYISIGYFRQKKVEGETGSSTMPHKVNPIDFENAEGNLGMANALSSHVGSKLAVSRWQRDLSDSTVLRSIGTCIGYSLVAYSSISRGIPKLEMNRDRIESDLNNAWEVLSEAIQTVLRKNGVDEPYEKIKDLTRGLQFDKDSYQTLLQKLQLTDTTFKQLSVLSPQTYVGLASQLTRRENERND